MYDIVIKEGMIVDFENNRIFIGDVGIKNGKIMDVGKCNKNAKKVINANGLIVSPGFIDIHMHEEVLGSNMDGDDYDIANNMLQMGVTTAVGGNCGNNRQDINNFFKFIDHNGAPINYLTFIGHNFLRNKLGIDSYKEATKIEVQKMKDMVKEYIESDYAIGISFGIEYSPGITFEEIVDLCSEIEDNILLSIHYRADADKSIDSIKEMIEISRVTNKSIQISHIGSCSAMGYMKESLDLIEVAIKEGLDITADCYPYNAFSTRIGSAVFDEGCFEAWNKSYDSILLIEEPYKGVYCDKKLFYKVRKEHPDMFVVAFVMNEEEVLYALKAPFVFVASDGMLNKGQGHPRAAGTFPKVIGKYVRDEKRLNLIDALKKMTLLPAQKLGLRRKGDIEVGMDGDITIFNPVTIIDQATFVEPIKPPIGIEYVIIDGKIALEKNNIVNNRIGKFIRKSQLN